MRKFVVVAAVFALSAGVGAQNPPKALVEPKVVTVPATIDHNRVIIEAGIPLQNGTTERIHAWIDIGNPELFESPHVAQMVGSSWLCTGPICGTSAPPKVMIGDMEISFDGVKSAGFPVGPNFDLNRTAMIPGVSAEMNLPASVLRHYDVLIDFPDRKVTIGAPGSIHFNGVSTKVQINPETGVITVPSKIENKKYDLELDLGSPMSSLSADLFDALAAAHSDWPHMTGAVGPASNFRTAQMNTKVMRLDRLQFGPLFLTNIAVTELSKERREVPGKVEDVVGAGLLGSEVLQNYRVGLDYTHSTVYFDIGRTFNFPDFDVVGLILRPEYDGQFSILGVADFEGKPSVPTGADGVQPGDHLIAVDDIPVQGSTIGQVWKMLGGTPGQERKLTIERAGKQLLVAASVKHFLGEAPESDTKKKR